MSQLSTRPPGHPPLPSPRNPASPKTAQPFTRAPRQPHITRTNSNSVLSRKQTSAAKSSRQHQFQIAIKYAKTPKQEQEEISFCNSQTNPHSALVRLPFEDSTDTIQKVMHYSRQKSTRGNRLGNQLVVQRGKAADVLSRGSRGSRVLQKSRVDKGNQDYYVYWKAKAHEYLESNMKLMQQNRKLTRENEQLREQLQTVSKNKIKIVDVPKISNQEEINNELRRVSKHYLGKIEVMEKQLKKKQVVIGSYQQKLTELTRQLSGDAERVKLLNKMREQIERLQAELKQQTKESHSSTSLENPYSTKSFKQIQVSPRKHTESRVFPT